MYLGPRTENFAKIFFLISCTGLLLYLILAFYTLHTAYTSLGKNQKSEGKNLPRLDLDYSDAGYDTELKYILIWTTSNDSNISIPEGQQVFTDHRCEYTNCFLTTNKGMLNGDYKNFDAIVFNTSVIKYWMKEHLPQSRLPKQKYIFYSMISSDDCPICNVNADNYFNWTWTYKLNSDIVNPFIEVTDLQGNEIAPKLNVKWITDHDFLIEEKTDGMKSKRKAVAWIMDKCNTRHNRRIFTKELQAELKIMSLDFDIYGCGNLECPKTGCLEEIKNNYFFYLAYEDSITEDYVTREVTKAYLYDAIPLVLGGADYSKFLPDGSYIKAHLKSADYLAAKLLYLIKNPPIYRSYFRWKKFYSIHETEELKGICYLCAYLNDKSKFGSFSVYKNFRNWWYSGSLYERCIPKGAEALSDVLSYINSSVHLI